MTKYAHIIDYVARTPWAMLESKMNELLAVLAFRASGQTFTAEEIQAQIGDPEPAESRRRGNVAVIPLRGVIAHRMGTMAESSGGMSAERFTLLMRAATADESIGAIVLDVDSPGGTIPGVMEAADAVFQARAAGKKVVAVANATMASAAYWIAAQAEEIVAIPSALDRSIGSIGVFTVHQDLSEHLAKEGVKVTLIKAGKHKADVNPFTPLTEEQIAEIQDGVNVAYEQFVKAVARGRGVSVADVKAGYGEGKALNAKDALKAGLIDRIATMDEVIGKLVGRKGAGGMRAEQTPDELRAEAAELAAVADELREPISQADGDDGRGFDRF